jgi:hypothetical protein
MTGDVSEPRQLELAIETLEQLRGTVADQIVGVTDAALRQRLDALLPDVERRRQVSILFAERRARPKRRRRCVSSRLSRRSGGPGSVSWRRAGYVPPLGHVSPSGPAIS